jgi:hypothetical protein
VISNDFQWQAIFYTVLKLIRAHWLGELL